MTSSSLYKFDFAFSFAGEDRDIVEAIKNILESKNYTVFYDNDFQHELIGKDLYSYLREIYRDKGKFIVCFISEHYAKKVWTNLEFTAIKERLMATFFASDFLIPIIINDAKMLKDIPSFIGFYKHNTVEETAKLLMDKFDKYLSEDQYLNKTNNCIQFICIEVCTLLNNHGISTKSTYNKIILSNNEHFFLFAPDKMMNIPCILVYHNDNKIPDLFISWSNYNRVCFHIHSFNIMKPILSEQSIKELIIYLEQYIKEYIL